MFQRYNHFLFCQYFFKTLTKIFFQTLFFAPLQPYLIHYAGNIQNHIVLKGEQGRAAPRHAARYLPAPRPLLPAAPLLPARAMGRFRLRLSGSLWGTPISKHRRLSCRSSEATFWIWRTGGCFNKLSLIQTLNQSPPSQSFRFSTGD